MENAQDVQSNMDKFLMDKLLKSRSVFISGEISQELAQKVCS